MQTLVRPPAPRWGHMTAGEYLMLNVGELETSPTAVGINRSLYSCQRRRFVPSFPASSFSFCPLVDTAFSLSSININHAMCQEPRHTPRHQK